jgi:hypothetical protein
MEDPKAEIVELARNYLRDFPRFFQSTRMVTGRTYELGYVNVNATDLYVATVEGGVPTALTPADYQLRERDGVLRIAPGVDLTGVESIVVEGDHYEWLTPGDLEFYAQVAIDQHTHNISLPLANMAPAVKDVIGIYTLVQALWGLLSEYSRDIDVISSESVHIPASQRFRMVQSLLEYWEKEYKRLAQALNIGLDRIEVLTLRRVSKLTNAYVPVYKAKEVGDTQPTERLWPETDSGVLSLEEQQEDLREDVFVDGVPPQGLIVGQVYY